MTDMAPHSDQSISETSPLGSRIAERHRRLMGGDPPPGLTDRDVANLAGFQQLLDQLSEVLTAEIEILDARDLDGVEALLARKTALVQAIEQAIPMVEPFLEAEIKRTPDLSDRIREVKALCETDGEKLNRLADTARTIAAEHARIIERHSLDGLYERSGRKLGASRAEVRKFDESH